LSNNGIKTGIKVGGQDIELVQFFNLLASTIDEDGGCQRKLRVQKIGTG